MSLPSLQPTVPGRASVCAPDVPRIASSPANLLGLDPKRVYRELDELFESSPVPPDPGRRIESFLAALYERFQSDLAVATIRVYAEMGGRFRLVEDLGEGGGDGPVSFESDDALVESLRQRKFAVYDEACCAQIEPPPGGQAAALLIDGSGARQLVLLFFDQRRDHEELEFVVGAVHATLTTRLLKERLGRSMREAAEIQASLLPAAPPYVPGFEVAGASIPAEEVGGDFFDYLPLDSETLGLAVGDASGHGLPAALLVRDVVVGLRMGMGGREARAGRVLERLNGVIHASTLSSSFVSLVYLELERGGLVEYWNAGHEPPLLFDGQGSRLLQSREPVLGPLSDPHFRRRFAHLDRGATLVLYTDGIVERRQADGEVFGVERLTQVVSASLDLPAQRVIERVFAAAEEFGGGAPWEDDATVVVLRRMP